MPHALSIIIPVYNESDNVDVLTREIVEALSLTDYHYEILFVDDGSHDDTPYKLSHLSQQNTAVTIRIITHQKNYGQSAALISGAQAAQYPWLVTLDGDGQNDPADIPHLLKQLDTHKKSKKPIVVFGNRTKRNDDWLKKISSRIGNTIRQWLLNDHCPDTGCSLKLFPKAVFLALPHFNHMHRFLPALFQRAGFHVVNVPVNHRPRMYGVSKYGVRNRLWTGIVDMLGVMWLMRRPCQPKKIDKSHDA